MERSSTASPIVAMLRFSFLVVLLRRAACRACQPLISYIVPGVSTRLPTTQSQSRSPPTRVDIFPFCSYQVRSTEEEGNIISQSSLDQYARNVPIQHFNEDSTDVRVLLTEALVCLSIPPSAYLLSCLRRAQNEANIIARRL